MKCHDYEQYILLEESGEISNGQQARLQTHLTTCQKCRAFKEDMAAVMNYSRIRAEEDLQVSEFTKYRIKTEARNALTAEKNTRVLPAHSTWQPIYAVAALLLIGLGIFLFAQRDQTTISIQQVVQSATTQGLPVLLWDDDIDGRIEALTEELTLASSILQDDDYYTDLDNADTDDLADELLLMEESS